MGREEDMERSAEREREREFERSLYCPKCGNKRLSVDGRWKCAWCDRGVQ